jgi:hypothetical protein
VFPEIHRAASAFDQAPRGVVTKPVVIVVVTVPRAGTVRTAPARNKSGQRPTGDVLGWSVMMWPSPQSG